MNKWIKALIIIGLIIYIVSPVDLIPDVLPITGWIDDIAAGLIALKTAGVF